MECEDIFKKPWVFVDSGTPMFLKSQIDHEHGDFLLLVSDLDVVWYSAMAGDELLKKCKEYNKSVNAYRLELLTPTLEKFLTKPSLNSQFSIVDNSLKLECDWIDNLFSFTFLFPLKEFVSQNQSKKAVRSLLVLPQFSIAYHACNALEKVLEVHPESRGVISRELEKSSQTLAHPSMFGRFETNLFQKYYLQNSSKIPNSKFLEIDLFGNKRRRLAAEQKKEEEKPAPLLSKRKAVLSSSEGEEEEEKIETKYKNPPIDKTIAPDEAEIRRRKELAAKLRLQKLKKRKKKKKFV